MSPSRPFRLVPLLLLLTAGAATAQTGGELDARLQRTLDSMRAAQGIAGISASVLLPGRGIWQGVSGDSHAGAPVAPGMAFGIGSNSKLFTAAAMLKMVERGAVGLEDTLGAWLPPSPNVHPSITIRQLLNHTSGISDVNDIAGYADSILRDPARVFRTEEVLQWVGSPQFAPGSSWSYSNTNYLLAGLIVERAAGCRLSAFLRDSILAPLQLDSTVLPIDEPLPAYAAHPRANGADISATPRVSLLSTAWCAGAMYSTSSEMPQWYAALLGGRVLRPASLAAMTVFVGSGSYGFGISERRIAGRTVWSHNGSIRGYSSQMLYDTALRAVICVLVNETPAPATLVAQQLLLTLAGAVTTSAEEPAGAAPAIAVYPNPASDRATIAAPRGAIRGVHLYTLNGVLLRSAPATHLDLAGLPAGPYVLACETRRGTHSTILFKR